MSPLLFSLALAEDASFVGTDAPGQKFEEPESHATATVGGTYTSGNTEAYAVNAAAEGYHRWKRNKLGLTLSANLGGGKVDADGSGILDPAERQAKPTETSRNAMIESRYDRFVGERDSLYVLAGVLTDKFAGYDTRSHVQLGYSRILAETERTKLFVEVGVDVAYEDYVTPAPDAICLADDTCVASTVVFAARELIGLEHKFNENVGITEKLEAYENVLELRDLRLQNDLSLSAKISDKLSFKVTDTLRLDNLPVEGFGKLDNVVTTGLVISLL